MLASAIPGFDTRNPRGMLGGDDKGASREIAPGDLDGSAPAIR
jgi:hypothetical protein